MKTLSVQFALSLGVVFFLFGCRQEPKTIFFVSFDNTLVAHNGVSSSQNSFQPEYKGYLKRYSLSLQQGNIINYRLTDLNLDQGALQFWIKAGRHFPVSRVNALCLFDGKRTLEFAFDNNSLIVERQDSPKSYGPVFTSSRNPMLYGRWYLITISWDGSATELYCNNEQLPLSAGRSPATLNPPPAGSGTNVSLGLWGDSSPFFMVVRDLIILNQAVKEDWVTECFLSKQPAAQKLVYRMRDFTHWNGKEIRDQGAADGIAWTTDTELSKCENIHLPSAGDYKLTFRIKPTAKIPGGMVRSELHLHNPKGELLAVFSTENKPGELKGRGSSFREITKNSSYQDFSLRFHAPKGGIVQYRLLCSYPGKYSLFLDTATLNQVNGKWLDQRRVEDLKHTMGIWREDPEATNGRAWTSQNSMNIGPYTCIGQPGKYRATWRLKISSNVPPHTPVVLLKVFAHDGFQGGDRRTNKDYGTLPLLSDDFTSRETWETKSIDFRYDGADMLEFIAHASILQPGSIRFDTITVEPLKK